LSDSSLLLATTNTGKAKEMRSFLSHLPFKIYSLTEAGINHVYQETGKTFSDNARGKSLFYSRDWPGLTLGEDSGLIVDTLGGDPGVHSARFAGPDASDADNICKLLQRMNSLPRAERKARFISCMVLSRRGRILHKIEKNVRGIILDHPRGHHGFGYDPVFFYPPLGKTFAEMSAKEKNLVSHRGKALHALKDVLERKHR